MNLFSYIKQRVPILDVVAEYASLKKAGYYWKGCCPFHHERTPSFTVTPEKEIFYCFGCHAGGDVISFIAQIEHYSALEAAHHLVERYNIALPEHVTLEKKADSADAKKLYYKTCTVFAQWCHAYLKKNKEAHDYILKRGITQKSIDEFMIGYCPLEIKSLLNHASEQGILAQNLIDASILIEGKRGLYCAFDDRIIFPIKDHLSHIVGFGGRVYKQGDERAKYYNSHDHTFFNKGTILYGLDRAKKAIADQETAFLVEGYTDLVIMHQYGYTTAVATLGTACTPEHLKQLSRYAQKLYLLYDGDQAGQNAIMRLVELSWSVSIDPYVITFPEADDPASFLVHKGNLDELIAQAHDIFTFVVQHLTADFKEQSLQERLGITKKILSLIATLEDPLKRDLLLQQASEAFGIPAATLAQSMRSLKTSPQKKASDEPVEKILPWHKISLLEKKLFSAILNEKEVITQDDEELLHELLDEPLKKIFQAYQAAKTTTGLNVRVLFDQLHEEEKAFASCCITSSDTVLPASVHDSTLDSTVLDHFYKKQWKKRVHDVKLKIDEAQKQGNQEQVALILNTFTALKKKLLARGIL